MTAHAEVTYTRQQWINCTPVISQVTIGNFKTILQVQKSKYLDMATWRDILDISLNLSNQIEVCKLSCIFTVYNDNNVQIGRSDNILAKTTVRNDDSGMTAIKYSTFLDSTYEFEHFVKVKCNITILDSVNNSGLNDISNTIFEEMKFADVNFIVQGKDFSAHKSFLTARSKVFEAMFDHQMAESETNNVIVEDIYPDVFQELLRFIYTGDIENLNEFAVELFCAADKYQLDDLKKLCEGAMTRNMSVENACEILIIADRHSAATLKTLALNFINSNVKNIKSTVNWMNFNESHAKLTIELFNAFIDTL